MGARNIRRGREPWGDRPLSQRANDLLAFVEDVDAIIILRDGNDGTMAIHHTDNDDQEERDIRTMNTLLNTVDAVARTYGLKLEFDIVPMGQG